ALSFLARVLYLSAVRVLTVLVFIARLPGARVSCSVSWAMGNVISEPLNEQYAINRTNAPSSSRMFDLILLAMYSATLSGTAMFCRSAFFLMIATFVSRSGG